MAASKKEVGVYNWPHIITVPAPFPYRDTGTLMGKSGGHAIGPDQGYVSVIHKS